MSILVKNITKIYGRQKALEDVSFGVQGGEVVGFLGPNGAGKSTMMKIITCFLPPTVGRAEVCGYDVSEQSMDVRRNVGYLPENNPLYQDMYVKEYLSFIAGIHFRGSKVRARVKEMIGVTGLGLEQHKKIGALSKGYRQRVGLAQALIHDPKVLILDEPTSGLDPNQLAEIRTLIRDIGREKTVMLSTHIMQEVEAVCGRVIIISKGKIVTDAPAAELRAAAGGGKTVSVEFDAETTEQKLLSVAGVVAARKLAGNRWELRTAGEDVRSEVFRFAVGQGLAVLAMQQEEQSLENVFRELTR